MDTKCNLEAFKNTRGNFLAIPEADLVLYKQCIGKNCKVYCFTHDEAKVLLKQKIPKLPGTDIKLPKNFIETLRIYITKLSPQAYIKDSQVSSKSSQARNDATRIERIPGEDGTTVTNLDWDTAINYCKNEFMQLLNDNIPDYESYLQKIEDNKRRNNDTCTPLSEQLIKVVMQMKEILPLTELRQNDWEITWHPKYPGLEITHTGNSQKQDILPATNMFNCVKDRGYDYNYLCEHKLAPSIMQLFLNKDTINLDLFGNWILGDELQLEPGYKLENLSKTMVGTVNKKYKLIKDDVVYDIKGINADSLATDLLSGKLINLKKYEQTYISKTYTPPLEKIIIDAKIYMGGIYKIHLQPKPEYQLWTMRKVFDILNDTKIKPYVHAFKLVLPYTRVLYDSIPALVIYPNYGKNTAQIVLDAIVDGLQDYDDIGINIVPRYNHTFNKLIYWANGNGDDKEALLKANLLDEYYDKTANYAHILCGDRQEECHIEPQSLKR